MFFTGDCILEVLKKSISDGLYGSWKYIKDKDKTTFEYHYVGGDILNLNSDTKPDMKEGVDAEISNGEYNRKHFGGTLKKVADNSYTFSAPYGDITKDFEFSFVKETGEWVNNTIVLVDEADKKSGTV